VRFSVSWYFEVARLNSSTKQKYLKANQGVPLAVPVAPAVRSWPRLRPCFSESCLVTGPADSERALVVDVNAAVASSPANVGRPQECSLAALTRTPTPPGVRSRGPDGSTMTEYHTLLQVACLPR
jgi:hypothetical protein